MAIRRLAGAMATQATTLRLRPVTRHVPVAVWRPYYRRDSGGQGEGITTPNARQQKINIRAAHAAYECLQVKAALAQKNSNAPAIAESQIEMYITWVCLTFCPAAAMALMFTSRLCSKASRLTPFCH
jgi:hypothetical protein